MDAGNSPGGLGAELRLTLKRGRDVWHLVPKHSKWALAAAAGVMALTSASGTAVALLLGRLVDAINPTQAGPPDPDTLYHRAAWFLGLIAAAYVLREGLNVLRRYLVENTCTRLNRDMVLRLVAHVMRMELGHLAQDKVGALHGRIFRSVDGFIRFLRVGFLDCFPAFFTGAFALTAAISKQPRLGLVMLGVIPIAVYLTVRQLITQKGVRLELMRHCEEIDGALVEQLNGMEYIRAAETRRLEIQRLARATETRRAKELRHHFEMSLYGCAKALNEGFFHVLVLGLAIYQAIQGQVSPGDVLTFSVLFLNVMAPMAEIHRVLDEGHEASLRVGDLLEMLHEPDDQSFHTPHPKMPELVPGAPAIEVRNLVVEYVSPLGAHVRALEGVSLTIRHGETIGVAGPSGSGKSTWIKVLLRLLHAHRGDVSLGGVHLAHVSREAIAKLVGYVGQAPFVFAGTIAENIAYGIADATPEAIRRAAELANLHDEIMLMPGGYDAVVTERGQNLSGGQRQRLAIARVLLRNPPILILDEATSALDNISERVVQQALGVTDANRTTILVAHRLSTLRDADRIFVFDAGHIVEEGAYEDLVARNGLFAELVASAEKGLLESPTSANGQPALAGAR